MIRVLLVEDHASMRDALAYLLDCQPDLTVVGLAGSLADARTMLTGVDVAILDLNLPDGSGTELIRELRAANPDAAVLVLTASNSRLDYARAIEQGAAAALHKSARASDIVDAARRLAGGEHVHSQHEIVALLQLAAGQRERDRRVEQRIGGLTPREHDVLQTLAEGLSEKDIARRLNISSKTAHNHVANILRKLDVESRLQALIVAVRYGLVTIDADDEQA